MKPNFLLAAAIAGCSLSMSLGASVAVADATASPQRQATVEQRSMQVIAV